MNWDQVTGNWNQLKGSAKKHWGKLTNDDLDIIAGERDELIGILQERYGFLREEAESQAEDWLSGQDEHSGEADSPRLTRRNKAA